MKLFIKKADLDGLYDVIKIDETSYICLLQDNLQNVLSKFKEEIKNQDIKSDLLYSFDSDTQIVMDYTEKLPVALSASIFTR